jgi:predicted  nucleic acid-binding Zn-ribbon protein
MQFEVDIATAELERAQQRLMALEKEKEDLVAQVSNSVRHSR